jgi:hypothetical protein
MRSALAFFLLIGGQTLHVPRKPFGQFVCAPASMSDLKREE